MSCLHRACNLENITPQRRLGNAFGFLAFVPVSVVAVIIAVVSPMAMSMTMPVAVTMSAGVFVLEVDFVERLSVGMIVVYYDKGWKCAASAMDMAFLYPKEPMYVQLSLNARVVNASRTATIPGLSIRDHASIAPNAASLVRRKSKTEIQSANWWKDTLRTHQKGEGPMEISTYSRLSSTHMFSHPYYLSRDTLYSPHFQSASSPLLDRTPYQDSFPFPSLRPYSCPY